MQGHKTIIAKLNELLTTELTSIDSYFLHSRVMADLGYKQLADHLHHEMEDEMGHATKLMQRIIFLGEAPKVHERVPFTVDRNVKSMFEVDLKFEMKVRDLLIEGIELCLNHNDHGTRQILEELLSDTESDHIDWLETQLHLIEEIGEKRYLAEKL
jgi:bacterioferritin